MARNNAINNKSSQLTLDPGSSGNSWIQHSNSSGTLFRIGVDDTDGDAYKISDGSALGTNDRFTVSAAGEITMPVQCAFLNTINAEANVTGDSTVHSIGSVAATTSVFDRNSDMTEGDGAGTGATFTAPVTGSFQFCFSLVYNVPSGSGTTTAQIYLSNATVPLNTLPTQELVSGFAGASGNICMNASVIVKLTASDVILFRFTCLGGTKTTDIVSGYISGFLIG